VVDHGLGRIYVPDARDYPPSTLHALLGVDHAAPLPPSVLWADAAILDQGAFGTCVGNGWAGWGDAEPIVDTFVEKDARAIYFEATKIDGQPDDPDAPGGGQQGSSVRSGAKAMQARGRLSAYAFTTTLSAVREWLANHGPVVFGSDWTNDMFNPDAQGFVKPTGGVAGGHCFLCIGYDGDTFRFRNSWGSGWALNGDFLMTSADVQTLLTGIQSPGEACLSAESPFQPAPQPQPSPASDADATLASAVRLWSLARHSGANRAVAAAIRAWLTAKGL
jgi:hypothetical protein